MLFVGPLDNDTWFLMLALRLTLRRTAIKLAHRYDEGVFAVIGLHPIHTDASYHDKQELGDEGKEFTSRGEVFNKNILSRTFERSKL